MSFWVLLFWVCLTGLLALLILAALGDLRERRIPNWLTGGVAALYPLYVLASPIPVAWLSALGLAAAAFVIGLVMFARNMVGGGDVKLIAALTLWAGSEQLLLFGLVTSLAGGALALGSLWYQRWGALIQAHLAGLGWNPAPAGTAEPAPAAASEGESAPAAAATLTATLPYGIAIAAGGFAVIVELVQP